MGWPGESAQAMADTIRVTGRRKQHLTAAWATLLTMIPASAVDT
ncbi:hypothetical protein [Streptomyces sp. NBC_00059]|nr:hypothetical protein [Streptomyces sp. NBC_00059]MCX5414985.1 hypothetical protein [Streptomyces sp. NBC_00059]